MKKIISLLLAFTYAVCFSQSGGITTGQLNGWIGSGNSPSTNTWFLGTKNSRSLIFKTNNTQWFKIDSLGRSLFSSTLSIGSSTAIGTSSLVQVYVTKGTSTVAIGEKTTGIGSIWINQTTPSNTNYQLGCNGGSSSLNGTSNSNLTINGNTILNAYSSGVAITGILTTSGASTFTGVQNNGNYSSTGNITTTGSGSLNIAYNYNRFGNLYLQSFNTSSLTTSPTSGTIAVLSDAVFPVNFAASAGTAPADATTYYFQNNSFFNWTTTGGATRFYVPNNCEIYYVSVNWYVNGVGSSAETTTVGIIKNGSTNTVTTIGTVSTGSNTTNVTLGTPISVTAGDWLEAYITTPTWVTNPGTSYFILTAWCRRKQ